MMHGLNGETKAGKQNTHEATSIKMVRARARAFVDRLPSRLRVDVL